MTIGRRLANWRALAWRDRRQLALYTLGLALVHAGLALTGYRNTRRTIEALSQCANRRPADHTDLEAARRFARLVAIAGRHGAVKASCLRQSLFVYGWLRRSGLEPRLQLGVKPSDGPFQAHAWVELAGERLLADDAGFQTFHAPFA